MGLKVHFTQTSFLKMPFPVIRESDESCDDMDGIEEIETGISVPVMTATENELIPFEEISPEMYAENIEVIKTGLRSDDISVMSKFPASQTIKAKRCPASHDFKIFTVGKPKEKQENAEYVFPLEDFPSGFINAIDDFGRRWKCVAVWTGTEVAYVVNIAAEIRLCGSLFSGTTKGGKVRWDKAVAPLNLIPGKFDSFAVSDKVLFERRKVTWPNQLKEHQKQCNILLSDPPVRSKKRSRPVMKKDTEMELESEPEKKMTPLKLQAQSPDRKRKQASEETGSQKKKVAVEENGARRFLNLDDADDEIEVLPTRGEKRVSFLRTEMIPTNIVIEITSANGTKTCIQSEEKLQVEILTTTNGTTTRNKIFCN